MMRLLGRASSINVRKVLWTGAEIGLTFEREEWGNEGLPLNDPAFLALNPNALVPVLVVPQPGGDFVLSESNAICRYLAAVNGRDDLLPGEPRLRAAVEQWMDWQATELNDAWRYAFMSLVRKSPAHGDPAAIAASIEQWNRRMTMLDARLAQTGAYVASEAFTLRPVSRAANCAALR